jgi:hypothetical protein
VYAYDRPPVRPVCASGKAAYHALHQWVKWLVGARRLGFGGGGGVVLQVDAVTAELVQG